MGPTDPVVVGVKFCSVIYYRILCTTTVDGRTLSFKLKFLANCNRKFLVIDYDRFYTNTPTLVSEST